jgi:hypothetical protein
VAEVHESGELEAHERQREVCFDMRAIEHEARRAGPDAPCTCSERVSEGALDAPGGIARVRPFFSADPREGIDGSAEHRFECPLRIENFGVERRRRKVRRESDVIRRMASDYVTPRQLAHLVWSEKHTRIPRDVAGMSDELPLSRFGLLSGRKGREPDGHEEPALEAMLFEERSRYFEVRA